MTESVKQLAKEIVPRLPAPLSYYCIDRIEARWTPAEQWRQTRRNRRIQADMLARLGLPLSVMAGPFAGMKYVRVSCGSALPPKLLGTYELETRSAVERLCRRATDVIFNLGAAEGYYAVGMAIRMPAVRVVAYDWWGPAHYWLRRIAFENRVLARVETRGLCTAAELSHAMETAENPTVICDVEGAEDELLDPAAVPALLRAAILVELHDMDKPGVSGRIKARFDKSHAITVMDARPRTVDDLPSSVQSPDPRLLELMDERRQGPQSWYLMTPRADGAQSP